MFIVKLLWTGDCTLDVDLIPDLIFDTHKPKVNKLNQLRIEVSAAIDAHPADLYAILADYRNSHPAILPKPYFSRLVLDQGGQGAGTIVNVHMDVYGMKRVFQQVVSEPEPGRVLAETDADAGVTTTFTVDPINGSHRSLVTITTLSRTGPGLQGLVERVLMPFILRRIYKETLGLLAEYARHGL